MEKTMTPPDLVTRLIARIQAMKDGPVPPTIATDEAFREVYGQGYRHALGDVLTILTLPEAPAALVALVREYQEAATASSLDNNVDPFDREHEANKRFASAETHLLAYPLPAAPPVTDKE